MRLASGNSQQLVRWVLLTGLWWSGSWSVAVLAQDADKPSIRASESAQFGLHIVRPGDTLMDITELYLGDPQRWTENWKLNPGLEDPHQLEPGERLRVLLPPSLPAQTALLVGTSRRVDDRPTPTPWTTAETNDLLFPQDSVRTHRSSSAELVFADRTRLLLTEDSLVFLGETQPMRQGVERRLIEIVEGQAELQSSAPTSRSEKIEIVVGQARAQPRRAADGSLGTRARRVGDGARVMVYRGESAVESAGRKVEVAQGMGTAVQEGAPPAPPEKLLKAPQHASPEPGKELVVRTPELRWQAIEGAASYTAEVCLDPRCTELQQRTTGLQQPMWQTSTELDPGTYFWRTTAVSESGLDGYPSQAREFRIVALPPDQVAPRVSLALTGGPVATLAGKRFVGREPELEVLAEDDGSGLDRWVGLLDDHELPEERWRGPWASGPRRIAVVAFDRAGNRAQSETLELVYDPDPPIIAWGFEGEGEQGRVQGLAPAAASSSVAGLVELQWSGNQQRWMPAGREKWSYNAQKPWVMVRRHRGRDRWGVWAGDRARLRHRNEARQTVRMEFDGPRVNLRSVGGPVTLAGSDATLSATRGVWIEAEDSLSRVERLSFQVVPATSGGPARLVVEARDAVGNLSRLEWALEP